MFVFLKAGKKGKSALLDAFYKLHIWANSIKKAVSVADQYIQ